MGSLQKAEASITAENMFTAPARMRGDFNLSISGPFEATVTLQRSFDLGSTWLDVQQHTEPVEDTVSEPEEGVLYRAGVKTGEFSSGTAAVRLSQ